MAHHGRLKEPCEVVVVGRSGHAETNRARIDAALMELPKVTEGVRAQVEVEGGDLRGLQRHAVQGRGKRSQSRGAVVFGIEALSGRRRE